MISFPGSVFGFTKTACGSFTSLSTSLLKQQRSNLFKEMDIFFLLPFSPVPQALSVARHAEAIPVV